MPTPKKTNSKTVAKEVPASKKKTCGKSDCKTAVDLEAPAKKKCCRKKASEPEKTAKPAKEAAAAAAEMEKKPAPKTARKAPVKKTAPAPVAPAPAPAKNELTDEQAEAIAAARAELAANPEWEPFVQMQRQHLLDLRDRALDNMSGVAAILSGIIRKAVRLPAPGSTRRMPAVTPMTVILRSACFPKSRTACMKSNRRSPALTTEHMASAKCHTRSFPSCVWRPSPLRGLPWNARPSGKRKKARMPGSVPEWPWALPEDKMM